MPGEVLVALAAHVLPIDAPPVRNGAVAIEDGRIAAVGPAALVRDSMARRVAGGRLQRPPTVVDLGQVALLPGLVNAHTHIELSWLAGETPPAGSMPAWVRSLLAARRHGTPDGGASAVAAALRSARETGTVAIGDIGNGVSSFDHLDQQMFHAVFFLEILGFAPEDPDRLVETAISAVAALPPSATVRTALAAHASYSVHPDVLRRLGREREQHGRRPMSVHLGESPEEREFLATGGGPWRTLLDDVGAWNGAFEPPAVTPAAYLDALGFLGPGVLAVHGVHLDQADLDRLARRGVTLVTCARSNRWTGVGAPPVERFYASGVPVAVGTDSLASNTDLSVFAEMAALREIAPGVPAARLLESATLTGARALGFEDDLGSLTIGKLGAVVSVDVPDAVTDVEEYLVSGVTPERIRWVERPGAWRREASC